MRDAPSWLKSCAGSIPAASTNPHHGVLSIGTRWRVYFGVCVGSVPSALDGRNGSGERTVAHANVWGSSCPCVGRRGGLACRACSDGVEVPLSGDPLQLMEPVFLEGHSGACNEVFDRARNEHFTGCR